MAFPTPTDESNSAARISRLIAKALPANGKRTALDAWAAALGIPAEMEAQERIHQVAQLLTDCMEEVRLLKLQLRQVDVPESLYSSHISNVEHALSVTNLSAAWSNTVTNYLSGGAMLSLAWCSYVLPNDGSAATNEDLAGLATLLSELEEALEAPGLPEMVRTVFAKHLAGMQRAMRVFPVRGAGPMKEAARAILADLNIDKDEIRAATAAADKPAMARLGGVFFKAWKKAAELSGDADKIMKTGKPLLDFISETVAKLSV